MHSKSRIYRYDITDLTLRALIFTYPYPEGNEGSGVGATYYLTTPPYLHAVKPTPPLPPSTWGDVYYKCALQFNYWERFPQVLLSWTFLAILAPAPP